jgi:hypothetical protein
MNASPQLYLGFIKESFRQFFLFEFFLSDDCGRRSGSADAQHGIPYSVIHRLEPL